jgi:Phage integrase, N-terminal SAM-like domain
MLFHQIRENIALPTIQPTDKNEKEQPKGRRVEHRCRLDQATHIRFTVGRVVGHYATIAAGRDADGCEDPREGGPWWLFIDYRPRRKAKRVCAIGSNRAESRRGSSGQDVELRLAEGDLGVFETDATPQVTVESYAEGWLASAGKTLKANTARFYEMNLRLYITPVIGKMPLAGCEALRPGQARRLTPRCSGLGARRLRVRPGRLLQADKRAHGGVPCGSCGCGRWF